MLTPANLLRYQRSALPMMQFSTYFKELYKASREAMGWQYYKVGEFDKIDREWRLPLQKKEVQRARREEREAQMEPVQSQDEILYVHNSELGVTLPPRPDQIFAVFRLMNR